MNDLEDSASPEWFYSKQDECFCPCHTDSNIKHIVACCHRCPICDRRIKGSLDMHIEIHRVQAVEGGF